MLELNGEAFEGRHIKVDRVKDAGWFTRLSSIFAALLIVNSIQVCKAIDGRKHSL